MTRVLSVIFTLVLLTFPAVGQSKKGKVIWPDCYCTDGSGVRVEMGDTSCLSVGGRKYLARCEMSLNNPMWREISESCVTS